MPRPRSAAAHRKVLDAAMQLIADRGVDVTSMDAIAAESGVSKATIYKHWADKEALLLEVLAEAHQLRHRPRFDSGNLRRDLIAVLSYQPQAHAEVRERMTPHLMAYASRNPSFGQTWRDMVMEPPRRDLKRLLKRGMQHGDLAPDLDLNISVALLLGPLIYWKVFFKKADSKSSDLIECAVRGFCRAFGKNYLRPEYSQCGYTQSDDRSRSVR